MRKMMDSGIHWIGYIPADWQVRKAKYCIRLSNGSDPQTEGNIPVYGSGSGSFKTCGEFKEGPAVLVGRKGTINAPQYITGQYWNVDTAFDIKAQEHFDLRYYFYLACSFDYPFYKSPTTTLPSMTQTAYENMPIPAPALPEQRRIAAYLEHYCATIDALIANQQQQIEKLKQYKQAVITEAVTHGLDSNVQMKDSRVEWIGAVPEHWELHRIAYLYEERKEPGADDLPLLQVSINTGVSDHEMAEDEQDRVFIRMEDKTKYKRVYPGDLTYNMMRAWQGAFGAVRVNGMVSPAYVVAKPRGNASIDTRYFEALLRTHSATEEMHRYSHGIMDFRLRLYWPEFRNIRVCLPPFEEQQRIAAFIDEKSAQIDALIAVKQKKADKLAQYKKSLIYEVVTGKQEV